MPKLTAEEAARLLEQSARRAYRREVCFRLRNDAWYWVPKTHFSLNHLHRGPFPSLSDAIVDCGSYPYDIGQSGWQADTSVRVTSSVL